MKKILIVLPILFLVACNNVKKSLLLPVNLETENKQEETRKIDKAIKNKVVTVDKVENNKIVRKKIIEANYIEYIFDKEGVKNGRSNH